MGKGSRRRPCDIKKFHENYSRIFKKDKQLSFIDIEDWNTQHFDTNKMKKDKK